MPPAALLIGVGSAQLGLVALLLTMFSPLVAFGLAVAFPAALAILLWPRLGVYGLAATIIGQWPWNLSRYAGLLVTVSALLWVLRTRRPLFTRSPLLILVGFYVALVLASAINPLTREEIWSAAVVHVSYFALAWLFVTIVDDRRALRTVVGLMVASGIVTAVVGLVQAWTHFVWPPSTTAYALSQQFFRGQTGLDLQHWEGWFRIDSITGTPDFLPLSLQTLMPFVFFWMVRQGSRSRRLLGVLVLIAFGAAHLLSFTRGAILTTAIVLFLMAWMVDRRRVVAFAPVVAMMTFLALMAWAPLRDRVISMGSVALPSGAAAEDSGAWRVSTTPIGIRMMLEHPVLGVGVAQQHLNWPESARHLVQTGIPGATVPLHNSYILAGVELGLGGLVILVALVVVALRQLRVLVSRFDALGEPELASYARASLVALAGLAIAMLGYPMVGSFRYLWLMFALAAALVRVEAKLAGTPVHGGWRGAVRASAAASPAR
jgi:O-antigen ligase